MAISHNPSHIPSHEIIPAKTDTGALANRINTNTQSLHDQVDKLVTLKFALAIRDAKVYRQGLQLFYHIFNAIEEILLKQIDPSNPNFVNGHYTEMFQSIYRPEMLRRENLYKDLMFFYGDSSKFEKPILEKQKEFSDHIRKVCNDKVYLLLAYMHVMYLALFAGGRIMSSKVTRSLGLFPQVAGKSYEEISEQATNFYKFAVPDMEVLRVEYKREYELATRNFLTEDEKLEIVKESQYIFQMVSEGVKEIEKHNLERIAGSWGYHLITKGYTVGVALMILLVCWIVKLFVWKFV